MDISEQINEFKNFFNQKYKAELLENIRLERNFIVVDFKLLSEFNVELANILLEQPEETFKAAELAISEIDPEVNKFRVRITNLPESQKLMIREIRSKHLGFLYSFLGVVRQKSDVRPQATSAKFECPSCGNIISLLQVEKKFKEPTTCGCGRKGKFRLLTKELIDAQGLVLEEAAEDLDGGEQPKRMNVFLKEDLVSPMTDRRTNPGSKVKVYGIVKEVAISGRDGGKLTRFDLIIEANYIEPIEEDFYDLIITPEEEEEILKIAKDKNVYEKLLASIAPSIYGHDKIKEAILLQLAGGVVKKRQDGVRSRGDMHILLIGDPGAGKSQLLKRIASVAPKARIVSGKGVSGAGLTAAVVKDEFLNGWSLEAGALPLSHKGFCCIDEMDKMSAEDTSAMHEALEQQSITISKANIQATLRCETSVLAAANPKFGRFDPYDILAKQINLPPALINRFDLIFPVKDLPDEEKDERMANHILRLHKDPDTNQPAIETKLFKKYFAYIRQRCNPELSDEAIEEIKKYYVELRNSGNEEGGVKSVPISARQLEALVRMSEASAKLRMSKKVTKDDAIRAINLLHHCLSQIGLDPDTGKIDMDRIVTGMTTSQRSKIFKIKELIVTLENETGSKLIEIEEIADKAKEIGIEEDEVNEALEKLKRSGDIYEPKLGFISRL